MIGFTEPMIKSHRIYDFLKYTAQILLPGLATLYFALSQIWGLPNGPEVVGTITAINTFLGVLLGLNSRAYNNSEDKYDGYIVVEEEEGVDLFSLMYDGDPYEILSKKEVLFKVDAA
jgi:hypothetical protein